MRSKYCTQCCGSRGGKVQKHMAMQSENLGTALHCTVSNSPSMQL